MIRQYSAEAISAIANAVMERGNKGDEFRRNLVQHAREDLGGEMNGPQFVEFIESEMKKRTKSDIIVGEKEPVLAGDENDEMIKIGCSDFNSTALDVILHLSSLVESFLTLSDACRPGVWAYINANLMQKKVVAPFWFAYPSGTRKDPEQVCSEEVDLAIKWRRKENNDNEKGGKLEEVARRIVRRFLGAHEIRGLRAMYQDVSLARAYWIKLIAEHTAESINRDVSSDTEQLRHEDVIRTIVHPIWPELSERIVSRQTVIGDQNILSGVILHLHRQKKLPQGKEFRQWLQKIGIMCSWRALGIFPPARVSEIIKTEILARPGQAA